MESTPPPRSASRRPLGWILVLVAGAAVGGSFLLRPGDDAPSARGGGARATSVTAAVVTRGSLTERGRYPGELAADTADVAAFYAGRVVAVRVRVGDAVAEGAVLAELDAIDAKEQIAQARAQARAAAAEEQRARVERDAALAEVTRLEPLARDQLISTLEIDKQRARANALAASAEVAGAGGAEAQARVRLLEKRLSEAVVRAPFAGRIAARHVDPGAVVAAGARLVRVVATAPLRVRFDVPEQEVGDLAAGTALRVVTRAAAGLADPAPVISARVAGVASEIDRQRRVAAVEALIEGAPVGWLPGMYAEVIVDRRTVTDATLVPAQAVLSRLQPGGAVGSGVFVVRGDAAAWVPVTQVARDGDQVAIAGAVAPGAQVLIAGHVDLADGSKIQLGGGGRP